MKDLSGLDGRLVSLVAQAGTQRIKSPQSARRAISLSFISLALRSVPPNPLIASFRESIHRADLRQMLWTSL